MTHSGVLIIEDDPDVREVLVEVLRSEGYPVQAASNGSTGLAYLRREPPPCLVLLDLMVPVMDGWQFRSEQLKDARLATIPVIIVSGHPAVEQQAKSLGVAAYLQKPVDPDRLLELVETHCGP